MQFESNALLAIKALSKRDIRPLHCATNMFFKEISLYISNFVKCSFIWTLRRAKKLAHTVVSGQRAKMYMGL